MAYVIKSAIICNRCGEKVDLDPSHGKPLFSSYALEEIPLKGWLEVDDKHHLCPKCANVYKAKQEEMQAELNKIAGITEIKFTL